MSRRAIALGLVLAALPCLAKRIRVGVFGLFRPTRLTLAPARGEALLVRAGTFRFSLEDGAAASLRFKDGRIEYRWHGGAVLARTVSATAQGSGGLLLAVPGKIHRRFLGDLEITAAGGWLLPVVIMDLETAVASATAAESPPGAPLEALKAQAVVARSYYAARPRHARFDFCDTTHCQFLREPPAPQTPAALAAAATRGMVLEWNGAPLAALYSASCGGRTRALPNPPPGSYPYFAVECPYCASGKRVSCSYCTRGEGAWPSRRGNGAGHGLGLCQTGAAAMAAQGAGFRAILEHYYPNTFFAVLDE
jgi:peptidoglycan hydrolase-like amidase